VSGSKAMPCGPETTGMVSITNPVVHQSPSSDVSRGTGFIVNGAHLSEPLKEYDEPLPVVALTVNWSAAGHATAEESKLHSTRLLTVSVLDGVNGRVTVGSREALELSRLLALVTMTVC
jgi:hypothetical protein